MSKKLFSCFVLIFILIIIPITIKTADSTNNIYSITEPYVYPLEQGSEEWLAMQPDERVEAYYISPEIINNMSTEALLQTVMNNPYFTSVIAFETIELELEYASRTISGFDELMARKDLLRVFEGYINEFSKGHISINVDDEALIALKIKIMQHLIESM